MQSAMRQARRLHAKPNQRTRLLMPYYQPDLPWVPSLPEVGEPKCFVTDFFAIADQRRDYDHQKHRGWCNRSGRIYMRCWYHYEKTPSLVIYPDGPHFDGPHFHCYGCGEEGPTSKLIRDLIRQEDIEIIQARKWEQWESERRISAPPSSEPSRAGDPTVEQDIPF